jgi:hypothetical protein
MDNLATILTVIHAVATIAMTGIIWFVQIVHYPLFDTVGEGRLVVFAQRHSVRTGFVVVPLMLVEAGCAVGLVFVMASRPLVWIGLVLLLIVWSSTFFLQVPQHRILSRRYDPAAIRKLVRSNWIRTFAWSARSGVAAALLVVLL